MSFLHSVHTLPFGNLSKNLNLNVHQLFCLHNGMASSNKDKLDYANQTNLTPWARLGKW